MRGQRSAWFVLGMCVLLACASTARAEGPGIRLGDRLVLHLGLAVEGRYDSNVFYANDSAANPAIGAFILRVLPSIDLATRPGQRGGGSPHMIDFRLHAGLDYNEFFGPNPLLSMHRSVGLQAGALLTILPYYPFTIDLFDNFLRTVQPPFTPTQPNLDRDTNEVGIRLRYRPGGGRLEFDLQYVFGLDFFEVRQLQDLNLYYHKVSLHASWKFLPKTSVYIDVSETPYVYQRSGPGVIDHPNSFPLRVIAGLTGLLTAKLSFNLWAGYANGFYQITAASTGQSPNTGIAGIDLRWKPTIFSSGAIGYKHDFANSLLGSYYDIDSAYISWSQLIWRFTGSLKLTYSNIRYQDIELSTGLVNSAGVPIRSRTDNYINFDARIDYPFRDWLIGSLGYVLQYNNTDANLVSAAALGAQPIPLNYLKHEVWLRLAVLY